MLTQPSTGGHIAPLEHVVLIPSRSIFGCMVYLCLFALSGVQHALCCVYWFIFLRLVYPMLPVSLCFSSSCIPYVASFSVFFFVLYTLCCQFLCVFLRLVYPMLSVSLCFSSSCIPYVASFSVFFFVLYTLCCQFLWIVHF